MSHKLLSMIVIHRLRLIPQTTANLKQKLETTMKKSFVKAFLKLNKVLTAIAIHNPMKKIKHRL